MAERDRLKQHCHDADFLAPVQTSAGDPGTVRKNIGVILNDLDEINNLHVHYTGGTKVMGVETVSAIEAQLSAIQNARLQTSYLDPRGASGPTIVSREGPIVKDTRLNVNLKFNLIALLNGFTLGPFEYEYWNNTTKIRKKEYLPVPAIPSKEQLEAGVTVLSAVRDDNKWRDFRRLFSNRDSKWNQIFFV